MLRASAVVALVLAVTLAGCSTAPSDGPGPAPTPSVPLTPATASAAPTPTPTEEAEEPSFGPPDPVFSAHFTDPLYTDEDSAFTPFGTKQGRRGMLAWSEGREELTGCTTARSLLEFDDAGFALEDPEDNDEREDAYLIAAGFGVAYLTGQVDAEGKQLALDALRRTRAAEALDEPPVLETMTRDLESFPASTGCPR